MKLIMNVNYCTYVQLVSRLVLRSNYEEEVTPPPSRVMLK